MSYCSFYFITADGTADYWILDTDYNDYALIYSCEDLEDDRRRGNLRRKPLLRPVLMFKYVLELLVPL